MTAVEWLESKMPTAFKELTINKELLQQAKQMEKRQIKNAFLSASKDSCIDPLEDKHYEPEAEQYYNETYQKGGKK